MFFWTGKALVPFARGRRKPTDDCAAKVIAPPSGNAYLGLITSAASNSSMTGSVAHLVQSSVSTSVLSFSYLNSRNPPLPYHIKAKLHCYTQLYFLPAHPAAAIPRCKSPLLHASDPQLQDWLDFSSCMRGTTASTGSVFSHLHTPTGPYGSPES